MSALRRGLILAAAALALCGSCADTAAIIEGQRADRAELSRAIADRADTPSARAELYRRRCRDASQLAIDGADEALHGRLKEREAQDLHAEAQRACARWRVVDQEERRPGPDLAAPAPPAPATPDGGAARPPADLGAPPGDGGPGHVG